MLPMRTVSRLEHTPKRHVAKPRLFNTGQTVTVLDSARFRKPNAANCHSPCSLA